MLRRVTFTPSSTLSQVVCDQIIKSLSGSEPPASTLPLNFSSGSGLGLVQLIAAGQRGRGSAAGWTWTLTSVCRRQKEPVESVFNVSEQIVVNSRLSVCHLILLTTFIVLFCQISFVVVNVEVTS